jgi:hypothetical protein
MDSEQQATAGDDTREALEEDHLNPPMTAPVVDPDARIDEGYLEDEDARNEEAGAYEDEVHGAVPDPAAEPLDTSEPD